MPIFHISDPQQPVVSPRYENVEALRNTVIKEEPNLRRSPAFQIHEKTPGITETIETHGSFDGNQVYGSPKPKNRNVADFPSKCGTVWESVNHQHTKSNNSRVKTAFSKPPPPHNFRYSCDVSSLIPPQIQSESHTRFIEYLHYNGNADLYNSTTDPTLDKVYPPPSEFSNESETSNTVQNDVHKDSTIVGVSGSNQYIKNSHPSHVRYKSQPHENHSHASGQFEHNQNHFKPSQGSNGVRFRNQPSNNRARPKSTPPGLYSQDEILRYNQYYSVDNQYNAPQSASRISGHQSERLTPRTNYNYSPTYHSSVWKPYLQSDIEENHIVSETRTSAFERPVNQRTESVTHNKYDNQVTASVYKSNQFDIPHTQETPYYPSGVYNIRSTTDSSFQKVHVHSTAVRTLSEEENQSLYRKLDDIQNSFDSNDSNQEEGAKIDNQKGKTNVQKGKNSKAKHNESINDQLISNSRTFSTNMTKCQLQTQEPTNVDSKSNSNSEHGIAQQSLKIEQLDNKSNTHKATVKQNINNSNKQEFTNSSPKPDCNEQVQRQTKPVAKKRSTHTSNHCGSEEVKSQSVITNTKSKSNKRPTEFVSQFDYKATARTALPLQRGEVIHVSMDNQTDKNWYWAYSPKLRRHGYVPRNYVQVPQVTII